jgi:voltage-gated sodium channel
MEVYPWAWAFFVPFILIATFTMLNLFIAIIVSTMQSMVEEQKVQETAEISELMQQENRQLHDDLRALRGEIQSLRKDLKESASG